MSDIDSTEASSGGQDELAKAAAAGPMNWSETGDENSEAAAAHDSPAAVDEDRAERAEEDDADGDAGRPSGWMPAAGVTGGEYATPAEDAHGPTLIRRDT